ncbi:MAG: DUF1338 domain-containing protein, partial [Gammaproteobacteria bacterium]
LPPRAESVDESHLTDLIEQGYITIEPMVYEDFLPVSAAGIFQSNLGDDEQKSYDGSSNQALFERDLGQKVHDLTAWYEEIQQRSIVNCLKQLNQS